MTIYRVYITYGSTFTKCRIYFVPPPSEDNQSINPVPKTHRGSCHPPVVICMGPASRASPWAVHGPRQPPHPPYEGTCSRLPTTPTDHRDTRGSHHPSHRQAGDPNQWNAPGTWIRIFIHISMSVYIHVLSFDEIYPILYLNFNKEMLKD